MCGIVAYVGKKSTASQIVFQGLKKLEYRGYDSWGVVVKTKDKGVLKVEKHIGKIGQAEINLPLSSIALGHTRWATHGGVTDLNAHPHFDCQHKIAVVHNGIVENYRQLKDKLKNKGHNFTSDTDTEVIAHLIEEKAKTQPITKAVFSAFKNLIGSNAIAVLDLENELILACRDGSPLLVGIGEKEYFLGSDVTPFLDTAQKVIFIKDGEGVVLSRAGVKLYEFKTEKEKRFKLETVDWKIDDAQKSGYPHYLLKEIMEQKETIAKTANLNEKVIKVLAKKIKSGFGILSTACGTASYCTKLGEYFFAQEGIKSQAYAAYEFLPFKSFCHKKTLLIAVSQSGETADTLIAAKEAKKKGAKIVALVNAIGSTLEREADYVLSIGAGPEIAVVSTKAFTSQTAALYLLSKAAVGKYKQGKKNLTKIKARFAKWLGKRLRQKIIALAKTLINQQDIYVMGKYLNYPVAQEFALKIKETSYIHSEAFAAGELKHGVISLIQKNTPCIVLLPNEKEVRREVISSALQLKSRGARIIGVGPEEDKEFDDFITTPNLGDLTLIGNVIVGQLLGYYLGVGRGCDPDKPRNLAKSVTVK